MKIAPETNYRIIKYLESNQLSNLTRGKNKVDCLISIKQIPIMKTNKLIFALILMITSVATHAQELTQTIRGTITDADGINPIIGASVLVLDSSNKFGARADVNGDFSIPNVPIGRKALKITAVGFQQQVIPNVELTSGKQVVLNIKLQERIKSLKKVVIKTRKKGHVGNEMSLISGNAISVEETQKYAGSLQDPSRMVTALAGVSGLGSEFDNDIIIRGNSPKYVQWRLEGIEIPSPNHFSQLGGSGGAISALNGDLLATSDFYTGAFTAEYGNVLSGVMDMKLRKGNNKKREYSIGVGLLGSDATFEGPFKKGYRGSYLVNIRYSTLAPAQALGVFDATDGIPKYRDAAFKLYLPTKKLGTFSLFGITGNSVLEETGTDSIYEQIGDNEFMNYKEPWSEWYQTNFYTGGINHTIPVSKKSFLKTTIAYASNGILADETLSLSGIVQDSLGLKLKDTSRATYTDFYSKNTQNTLRVGTKLDMKINSQHKIEVGTKFISMQAKSFEKYFDDDLGKDQTLLDFNESINSVRSYASWKYRVREKLTLVSGLHHFHVLFNGENSLEPRLAARYQIDPKSSVTAGYGRHSTMESIPNYFAKVENSNGTLTEPNRDLELLKADHFVLGYKRKLSKNLNAKVEVYYQRLFNLPVHNNDSSFFSTINEVNDFDNIDLVNKGTGKNYGIELTLEKYFSDNYYFMLNGSLFDSKYTSLENIERNTVYNSNFSMNALYGKEFVKLGKKKNKVIGLNGRINYTGAKRIIPLYRNANGQAIFNTATNSFRDISKAYENGLDNLFQVNFGASYKINRPKATHEFTLDIINLLNNKANVYEFYNPRFENNTGYVTQLSLLPNILYRVHF